MKRLFCLLFPNVSYYIVIHLFQRLGYTMQPFALTAIMSACVASWNHWDVQLQCCVLRKSRDFFELLRLPVLLVSRHESIFVPRKQSHRHPIVHILPICQLCQIAIAQSALLHLLACPISCLCRLPWSVNWWLILRHGLPLLLKYSQASEHAHLPGNHRASA